jgi:hypothetical protein
MNVMVSQKIKTILRHQGAINGPIISELLDDLDFKCINRDISDVKRKKIFNLAVEMYQNLYQYTRDLSVQGYDDQDIRSVYLSFDFDDEYYYLTTENYVSNEDVEGLIQKIDLVNKLDSSELRAYYREILSNEQFSEKGGAGLGFIDMKKRSGLPLEYQIEKLDENISKYILTVKVEK